MRTADSGPLSPSDAISELTQAFGDEQEGQLATSIRITEEFVQFIRTAQSASSHSVLDKAYIVETIQAGTDAFFGVRQIARVMSPEPSVSRQWLSFHDFESLGSHCLVIHDSMLEATAGITHRVDCLCELIRCQLLYAAESFCT
jgi:hypothetical protein